MLKHFSKRDVRTVAELFPHLLRFAGDGLSLIPGSYGGPDAFLRRGARIFGDADALLAGDQRWSWRELDAEVDRWARALRARGLREGDAIALMMDNRPEFLFVFHAANRLGVLPALINTSLQGAALAHVLRAVPIRAVIAGEEHLDVVDAVIDDVDAGLRAGGLWYVLDADRTAPAPEVSGASCLAPLGGTSRVPLRYQRASDVCCYIYTSGTTGFPKAARVRALRIAGAGALFGRTMHRSVPGDRIYIVLPLYHTNALGLAWGSCLATGAAAVLRRRFSVSSFWDDVHRYDVTSFVYIGEVCRYLTQAPKHPLERSHRLRAAIGNGAREEVARTFSQRFDVPSVREFYGSTEGDAFTLNVEGRPGFIGRMRSSHELLRADLATGELQYNDEGRAIPCEVGEAGLLVSRVRSAERFDGYTDAVATQAKLLRDLLEPGDIWFNTGDLIRLHEEGWLSFVDRVGDTYRWRGENVSTAEVEALLMQDESLVQAIVFGVQVPDQEGRAGMAVLHAGEDFSIEAFGAFVRGEIPRFQQPRFVRVLDEALETTATHKLRKAAYQSMGWSTDGHPGQVYLLDGEGFVLVDSTLEGQLRDGTRAPS